MDSRRKRPSLVPAPSSPTSVGSTPRGIPAEVRGSRSDESESRRWWPLVSPFSSGEGSTANRWWRSSPLLRLEEAEQWSVTGGTSHGDLPSVVVLRSKKLRSSEASRRQQAIQKVIAALKDYEEISGQLVSFQKTAFYMHPRTPERVVARVRRATGCVHKSFPFTYLGCPVYVGRKKCIYFASVVDKVKAKCLSWQRQVLSKGGKARQSRASTSLLRAEQMAVAAALLPSTVAGEWAKQTSSVASSSSPPLAILLGDA
nr:uncharacterized protein LOC109153875 [Ipomoea batatas]